MDGMLQNGFYVLERKQLRKHAFPRPKARMSAMNFFRALRRSEPLPDKILIEGLDRMTYQIYRLHGEGEEGKEAVDRAITFLGRALYRERSRLLRQTHIVMFAMEYVEHGERWRAGVRIRKAIGDEPMELFWLERLLPYCEVTEIEGERVCYSRF